MSAKWVVVLALLGMLAGLELSMSAVDAQREPPGHLKKTPTLTVTPSPSATPSPTPTSTLTPTATPSPSPTLTPTPTPTDTETPTETATSTPTETSTPVPSDTPTLTPSPTPQSFPDWKAEYFDNMTLSGVPVLIRNDPVIDFDWELGSPGPGVPADNFSVRWTRTITIPAGPYVFRASSDDGERLYVDGVLVIDAWYERACTENQVTLPMVAGPHALMFEVYENLKNACAKLDWAIVPPTSTPTETPTSVPTDTPTGTPIPSDIPTDTPTPTETATPIPSDTSTATPTGTSTTTDTPVPPTATPTVTPTETPSPPLTDTPTATLTPAAPTVTDTPIPILTVTETATPTETVLPTPTYGPADVYHLPFSLYGCLSGSDAGWTPEPCPYGTPIPLARSGVPTDTLGAGAALLCENGLVYDFGARGDDRITSLSVSTISVNVDGYQTPEPTNTLPNTPTRTPTTTRTPTPTPTGPWVSPTPGPPTNTPTATSTRMPTATGTPTVIPPPGSGTVWQFGGTVNGQQHVADFECWAGWDWYGMSILPYLRLDWLN